MSLKQITTICLLAFALGGCHEWFHDHDHDHEHPEKCPEVENEDAAS